MFLTEHNACVCAWYNNIVQVQMSRLFSTYIVLLLNVLISLLPVKAILMIQELVCLLLTQLYSITMQFSINVPGVGCAERPTCSP